MSLQPLARLRAAKPSGSLDCNNFQHGRTWSLSQVAHSPYASVNHCIRVMLKEEGAAAFFKSLRTTVRALSD